MAVSAGIPTWRVLSCCFRRSNFFLSAPVPKFGSSRAGGYERRLRSSSLGPLPTPRVIFPKRHMTTVTMSPQSAQRACTLGGCQLPRIIFDCPGPADGLRFRPSFLMCPVDSKSDAGTFGKDRIEIGEDNMKLARPARVYVPFPPATSSTPEDEAALVRDVLKSGKRTYLADFSVLAT
jgi:hypothetical protein